MKGLPFVLGRVAVSKQGHDKGRWMLVVGLLDERYALVADGRLRKLEKPKKKQTMHLRAKPFVAEAIGQALAEKKPLMDSEVRKAIALAMEQEEGKTAGNSSPSQKKEECALVKE